jgi:hypothetical protein
MTGRLNAREMLDQAARAAAAGDLTAADRLLRAAADVQEAELGPLDPDRAYTLNNLAVVAERAGRLDEAEGFYRRATAIAAAALPPDDPMVLTSRKNLEDFCRVHGLPVEAPAAAVATADPSEGLDAFVSEHAIDKREISEVVNQEVRQATPNSAIFVEAALPEIDVADLMAAATAPEPSVPHRRSYTFAWATAGLAGLAVVGLLLMPSGWRAATIPSLVPSASPEAPADAPSRPAPTESPAVAASPEEPSPAVKSEPAPAGPAAGTAGLAPEPATNPRGLALPTIQMCRRLSTTRGQWRCEPAADPVAPGPLVLYTRVQSSRDATIFHRWYRGDSLRQSVRLNIRANAREGYRTYSRQTVDRGADWRVEVTDVDGRLLHQQHLVVE